MKLKCLPVKDTFSNAHDNNTNTDKPHASSVSYSILHIIITILIPQNIVDMRKVMQPRVLPGIIAMDIRITAGIMIPINSIIGATTSATIIYGISRTIASTCNHTCTRFFTNSSGFRNINANDSTKLHTICAYNMKNHAIAFTKFLNNLIISLNGFMIFENGLNPITDLY
jgi:hypothetical protein